MKRKSDIVQFANINPLIATLRNNVYKLSCLRLIRWVRMNDLYPILTEIGGKSYHMK